MGEISSKQQDLKSTPQVFAYDTLDRTEAFSVMCSVCSPFMRILAQLAALLSCQAGTN